MKKGRGGVGRLVVATIRDRETWEIRTKVVPDTTRDTFMQGFVHANTSSDAIVYTDEHSGYTGIGREHGTVCHSVGACTRWSTSIEWKASGRYLTGPTRGSTKKSPGSSSSAIWMTSRASTTCAALTLSSSSGWWGFSTDASPGNAIRRRRSPVFTIFWRHWCLTHLDAATGQWTQQQGDADAPVAMDGEYPRGASKTGRGRAEDDDGRGH